jgi:hypothetical protein
MMLTMLIRRYPGLLWPLLSLSAALLLAGIVFALS